MQEVCKLGQVIKICHQINLLSISALQIQSRDKLEHSRV